MQRSLAKRLWYHFLHILCRTYFAAFCQVRVRGRDFEPSEGGVLLVSNHQSHLDPVLVGLSCRRRLNYLARSTLFAFPPFRWLIQSLDAIPIEREGIGMGGLKETLRRLRREEMVLIFPEGTRTANGEVAPLKPGFCVLARKGRAPLLPVAIEGAFAAWPRQHGLPRPAVIHLQFGPPLRPEDVQRLDDDQLVTEVQARITACHAQARLFVQRATRP
ncbi:MAG: 1-acyl-sn-glycerol-3-phosphate acyltransferase [Planctomycetales bacterium]|nr:1-acyl-sn-glycerol-3-phosphate acyltransferase [Planctomycetales bacterium]NIM07915.1 1-acyl-sn-glycerol-3-phosphate acyltransferase [Planctomycetales bacterium]NIN07402.1 1-acyl-sn-glycerol-3-phosphate acyltransferase [Planctomycetales bacterium]NIN76506.1 1-acyl-sn-glycerol-3-phosphate acyltransferase [Planctomycetales bacterium]NIO33696.1 1-acyl-sn-glycerol-3-phosphate acyltransferase [Planctomycetales bacterium]